MATVIIGGTRREVSDATLKQLLKSHMMIKDRYGNMVLLSRNNTVSPRYSANKDVGRNSILPSEEIAAQKDRQWVEDEARRQTEQARTRANEQNTRSFYTNAVLPALTLGMSEYIPGLKSDTNENTAPLYATAAALQKSPAGKLFWPAAVAAGLWSWYANTHEPPTYYTTSSYPISSYTMLDEAPAVPGDSLPTGNPTSTPTEGTTGSTQTSSQAAPSNPDPNDKNKKSKIPSWAKELLPGQGYSKTNWGWNIPRVARDATYANWGIPTIANGVTWLNTGKTPVKFPLTSYIPGVFEDNSVKVDTLQQRVLPNGQVIYIQPGDSLPSNTFNQNIQQSSPVERNDSSSIFSDL